MRNNAYSWTVLRTAVVLALLAGCTAKQPLTKITSESAPEPPHTVLALSSSIAELWLLAGGSLAGVTSDAFTERDLGFDANTVNLGSIFSPNLELIVGLQPDLVLLSRDIPSHVNAAEILRETGIPARLIKVESPDDYFTTLADFTGVTGDEAAFRANGEAVRDEIAALLSRLPIEREPKRALLLRAYSSGVTAIFSEHQVCTILEDLGVSIVGAEDGARQRMDISVERIIADNPDFIFVVFQGDEEKARAAFTASFTADPAWNSLPAVRQDRLVVLPKDLYHFKPNKRWAEAYKGILAIVYPDFFSFF